MFQANESGEPEPITIPGVDTATGGGYPTEIWTLLMGGALDGQDVLQFPERTYFAPLPSPTGEPSPSEEPSPTLEPSPTEEPSPTLEPSPLPEPTRPLPSLPDPSITFSRPPTPTPTPTPTTTPTPTPTPVPSGPGNG